ncbi:DUF3626 domain-containing protein [Dermacoccaceae bacterium W4C1]
MSTLAEQALAAVRERSELGQVPAGAQLTVNVHPDRIARSGGTVIEALLADGVLRTQFETGISAGGLDEAMGGARSRWEHRLFGGAYDSAPLADRPRYAGLDLVGEPWGACPRFGSCHLRLSPAMLELASFTWGDSATEPTHLGVHGAFGAVDHAAREANWAPTRGEHRAAADLLDGYIEAQVHHRVHLARDVEALVLDGSFAGTQIAEHAEHLAQRYELDLAWAPARVLGVEDVDAQFRTAASPPLAEHVAHRHADGTHLDARSIGAAAVEVARGQGDAWGRFGNPAQVQQELKYLWHHLVRFGTPSAQ